MAYEVPALPYDYNALEPHIDEADDAHPSRQAPPGLRGQGECRPRGHRVGRPAGRGRPQEPLHRCPPTSRARSATTPAATPTTRCSGRCWARTAAASRRRAGRRDRNRLRRLRRAEAADDRRGRNRFGSGWSWLVVDNGGLKVIELRQPGLAALRRPDADPRHRRVGARVLPEVPEQPARLPGRDLERRRLERGRPALRAGSLGGGSGLSRRIVDLRRGGAGAAPPRRGNSTRRGM